ncbi:GNAT family N-acetyltransferase [Paenibacillus sp. PK3_47]|uniref:GNAT family N-acetyltransferase n=1 Tax=Paenibacillus sp. PK3_47 TaxID=2072642 RepID=UPI00201DD521|nr:GNAT family N-acetyltransferase [Paenibacillus sp. PK3_47]UQZ36033.1 GNAT family N-acetyltransferase [Paenibacillus sp. PK3_47]
MHKRIEEISLNTWPAEQSLLLEGWVLRTAAGYTKRANSVNPLYGPDYEAAEPELSRKISTAEQYYSAAGLDTVFKMTPFTQPAGLDGILAGQGYIIAEPSSVRLRGLDNLPRPSGKHELMITNKLTEEWLEAFAELTRLKPENRNTLRRMLAASCLRQGYALLLKEGVPVTCGLGVIESGMVGLYDIVTSQAHRRQGLAQEMLLGLLHWAGEQGADTAFLQVVQANSGASALYDKLGFKEIYTYWYRIKARLQDVSFK